MASRATPSSSSRSATAAADPDGGLLVSVDMLVDGDQPFGERYDSAAAAALFGDLVERARRDGPTVRSGRAPGEPAG